jgi:hypothetical protein
MVRSKVNDGSRTIRVVVGSAIADTEIEGMICFEFCRIGV